MQIQPVLKTTGEEKCSVVIQTWLFHSSFSPRELSNLMISSKKLVSENYRNMPLNEAFTSCYR